MKNSTYCAQPLTILALLLAACAWAPSAARAAFGLTSDSTYYTVDTGAGLIFKVRRIDNGVSTQSAGDIASLVYNGVQCQDQSRGSQVNSGFDNLGYPTTNVTVNATTVGIDFIKITVVTDGLTHYYLAHRGDPCIYMGTYFSTEPVTGGALCRYILRMQKSILPNGPAPSELAGTDYTVESADIFGFSASNSNVALRGQTRSKHYSNMRLRDWAYIGATGNNIGLWVVRDNNEGGSGGPFFRCLLNQGGSDQEITYIVNYGEGQTEAFRTGILNTYTLVFTNGATPPLPFDTRPAWFGSMNLTGYVPDTGRGSVTGAGLTGRDSNYLYTIGFSNSAAQYWTTASATDGSFSCTEMLPGTYTMTVYKNELAVSTGSVSVTAGGVTPLMAFAITGDPSRNAAVFRIGDWDGSPREFLNGDKVNTMHPSDVRMASWTPGTYVVGTSNPATSFPCYQWKDVNGSQAVQFNLTAKPSAALTVRVGITTAYAGARPKITVNSWTSSNPAASTQPSTRTLTVGTYRGNNTTYTFSVPVSAFVAGTNTLTIIPISGSGSTGFLSAGYSLDCVDLIDPSATAAPGTVSGTASLQGLASGNWAQPLTFTLTPTGTTAGSISTRSLTPAADGAFTLTNVPAGTYTLGIKGAQWLRRDTPVDTTGGSVSGLSVFLLSGDINNDNQVTTADYDILNAAYGSTPGSPKWNAAADLDGSGRVNALDYALLQGNLGKTGDP